MTYCENCGRESHCGVAATMKVNAHDVGIYEAVVCKSCICSKCKPKEEENGS